MVAYNFQKRFAPDVRSGAKKNTIRAMRKGRSRHALPGEALQLYTGMRTATCEKLTNDPVCSNVQRIAIERKPVLFSQNEPTFIKVVLNERFLSNEAVEKLAIADGFNNVEEFAAFFEETHGLPFEGVLISWE